MRPEYRSARMLPTPEELARRNRRIVAAVKARIPMSALRERFGMSEDTIRRICAETAKKESRP